jgi:hypothetical protein
MSTANTGTKSVWAVIQRAQELSRRGTGVAIGVCLFEALYEVDKVSARALQDTMSDPALCDENIDRFLAHLSFRFNTV